MSEAFPAPVGYASTRRLSAALSRCNRKDIAMILPRVRDPRFITIRRGGTLINSDN
jgi:hypothetical protein